MAGKQVKCEQTFLLYERSHSQGCRHSFRTSWGVYLNMSTYSFDKNLQVSQPNVELNQYTATTTSTSNDDDGGDLSD